MDQRAKPKKDEQRPSKRSRQHPWSSGALECSSREGLGEAGAIHCRLCISQTAS
jgi:hypothetical protein